jgi:hypothetical protein
MTAFYPGCGGVASNSASLETAFSIELNFFAGIKTSKGLE